MQFVEELLKLFWSIVVKTKNCSQTAPEKATTRRIDVIDKVWLTRATSTVASR
jgi:hypothetical protein